MCTQLKKFTFILFLLAFAITANADKWAVIVGINDYKILTPDLRYCESDALKMKNFLTEKAGFGEDHIKTLLGKEATKKNIRESIIKWLATNVKPGDRAVFYFSGHGVQIPDDNNDEEDGLDEVLCAYDSGRIDFTFIRDDEMGRWLREVKTDNKIVILDCCHSGTGTKAVSLDGEDMPIVKAYYPTPDMAIQRATEDQIKSYLGDEREAEKEIQAIEAQQGDDVDGVSSISGCRDDQVSMESPRLKGGVLTYYLTKTLGNLTDQEQVVTVYDAWKSAKNEIRKNNWQQEPQFGGSQNISIVSDETTSGGEDTHVKKDPFDATITSASEDLFRISIGENKDVTRGSIYSVYSKDAEKPIGEPKIKIRISNVMEDSSEAIILEDSSEAAILVGDKVIEESHYIEAEDLLVRVEPFKSDSGSEPIAQDTTEEVKKAIGEVEHVLLVEKGQTPDLIIRGNIKKTDSGKFKIIAQLINVNIASSVRPVSVLIEDKKQVHGAVFTQIFADPKDEFGNPIKDEYGQPIPGFMKVLKRSYVMKSLAKLENPRNGFDINLSIDKGSQAVYKYGDVVSISMEPTRDCYVYILDIGTSGAITLLFPNQYQSDNYLKAGQKFVIDSYDESGDYKIEVYPPPGEERIKAIATTIPIPLEELKPDDMDSPIKTFTDNAPDVLEIAMKDLRIKPRNKWAVEDVFFRIENFDLYKAGSREPLELGLLE